MGPAFDVLDWKSYTTGVDSYLRVAEPVIWRYTLSSVLPFIELTLHHKIVGEFEEEGLHQAVGYYRFFMAVEA